MQVFSWQQFVRLIVFGASFLLLLICLGTASRAQAARPDLAPAGVARIFGVDDGGNVSASDAAALQAADGGAYVVRGLIRWDTLEPTEGVYNFNSAEAVINRFLGAGLKPLIFVAYNPVWAADTKCGPVYPAKLTAFANTMGALAAHFPKVKVWALYNEIDQSTPPDSVGAGCFGSYGDSGVNNNGIKDSKEYAIMLAAAWKAVHAANPKARLASGAVAYDNFDTTSAPSDYPGGGAGGKFNYKFLDSVFKYMRKHPLPAGDKYFDMLLFNYYDIYGRHWEKHNSGFGIQAKAADLRAKMTKRKVPVVPLLVTETGEDSYSLGLKAQARCLDITLVRGVAAKLKGIVWWTFKDFPDSAPPPSNTWKYGIVDQNFQPKPSYTALQTLTTELNGYKFKGNFSLGTGFAGVEAYRFQQGSSYKFVVWSATYTPPPPPTLYNPQCSWGRHRKLATFDATALRVVEYLGKTRNIADNSKKDKDPTVGKIAIKTTSIAKIVEINP